MRHISRTINLSQYKSFMQGLMPSYKDGLLVDIKKPSNQVKFNSLSNFSMMPSSCSVKIDNNDELIWSWDTLHRAYIFLKNNNQKDICTDNPSDYEYYYNSLFLTFEDWYSKYNTLQISIISFVENGIDIKNDNIKLVALDKTVNNVCNNGIEKTNIAIPLHITNNIDNLGQVTNLIEEWQPKTVYNKGDIVSYDNNDWILTNDSKNTETSKTETYVNGYTWNDTYKESVFGNLTFDANKNSYIERDELPWERNISYNMGLNNSGITKNYAAYPFTQDIDKITYAYKGYNLIYKPNPLKMADAYHLTKMDNKFIIYNNDIIEIKNYACIKDFNCIPGITVIEFECEKPYIYYTNRKIYGIKNSDAYIFEYNGRLYTSENLYGYLFNNSFNQLAENTSSIELENGSKQYSICTSGYSIVNIENINYVVDNNDTIKEYQLKDDSYSEYDKSEVTLFGEKLVTEPTNSSGGTFGYFVSGSTLYLCNPYQEYLLNIVSGECASHISMFKENELLYDDLGSFVEASLIVESGDTRYKGVARPLPNDSLSLIYKEGTVRNLTFERDEEDSDSNIAKIYWGNILHTISFQILTNGNRVLTLQNVDLSGSTGNQLKTIYDDSVIKYDDNGMLIWDKKTEYDLTFEESLNQVEAKLQCVIKYNIGCFIERNAKWEYSIRQDLYQGIAYTDVYTITRNIFMYGRSINDRYPVYYYSLEGDLIDGEPKTTFTMEIPIYKFKGQSVELWEKDRTNNYFDEQDNLKYDMYKGFITSPVIRQEYNLGTAFQEKVFGDIYIDRGISSAFEKHLKLQEIKTLQDLENYSNGGFFSVTKN